MASGAKACFSSDVEYRAVFRYLYLKSKNRQGNTRQVSRCLWVFCTILRLVQILGRKFKRGRTSLENEARSGCPLDACDEEMCKKVRDLVYSDRRIQVAEIVQTLGISHGSFQQSYMIVYACTS